MNQQALASLIAAHQKAVAEVKASTVPIWKLRETEKPIEAWSTQDLRLVGMAIAHYPKDRLVASTRIDVVRQGIFEVYPDLAGAR